MYRIHSRQSKEIGVAIISLGTLVVIGVLNLMVLGGTVKEVFGRRPPPPKDLIDATNVGEAIRLLEASESGNIEPR